MTDTSPNLNLPYLLASQTQKHATLNEIVNKIDALLMLSVISRSVTTPPNTPVEGNRYIIPENATGEWQDLSGRIAAWQNLSWVYTTPNNGFITFIQDEGHIYYYKDNWINLSQTETSEVFNKLGIGTNSDSSNPFTAKLNNALFSSKYSNENGDGNIRLKLNKETANHTASFIFQDNWSGRAEIGLIGNDNFGIKISNDGNIWTIPFSINANGDLNFMSLKAPTISDGNNDIIKSNGNRLFSMPKIANTLGCNLFIGIGSGSSNLSRLNSETDASYNIGIGNNNLKTVTSGRENVALGTNCLSALTGGTLNIAIGFNALKLNTIGSFNIAMGEAALMNNVDGSANTALGTWALSSNINGIYNTAIGQGAGGLNTLGSNNTSLGVNALRYKIDGFDNVNYSNCTGVGANTKVSASNQVQLGDSQTTVYAYGAVQNRSDARDKTEIRDTIIGLEFIKSLRPVDFKWDMRDDYFENAAEIDENNIQRQSLKNIRKDGSKKGNRFHHGLIAQEVKEVMDTMQIDFGGYQNHALNGGSDVFSIGYTELIAPLIKAVQQLSCEIDILKSKLD